MTHPQLRLAAAKFALDLINAGELVDAAHFALNDAFYADGLAVIATTWDIAEREAKPHFIVALRDLGHAFDSPEDALRYLRLSHFGPVAEGTESPAVALDRYAELRDGRAYGPLAKFGDTGRPAASTLVSHWYDLGYLRAVHTASTFDDLPEGVGRGWDERAVHLCRVWCREYARLNLQPVWRSPAVDSLAAAIHADRAFDRLPVLADALEEAGCDHPDLLGHCRHNTPHTDYCWLVDAVLNGE